MPACRGPELRAVGTAGLILSPSLLYIDVSNFCVSKPHGSHVEAVLTAEHLQSIGLNSDWVKQHSPAKGPAWAGGRARWAGHVPVQWTGSGSASAHAR